MSASVECCNLSLATKLLASLSGQQALLALCEAHSRVTSAKWHLCVAVSQGEITVLPWAELEGLHQETSLIKDRLLALNAAGKQLDHILLFCSVPSQTASEMMLQLQWAAVCCGQPSKRQANSYN